ncbi:MAG: DNA recombination protein RmuC [Sphingomonas fennica]
MELLWVAAIVLALGLGVLVGWLVRAGAVARAEAHAAELPPLRLMVDGLREERDAAQRELAAARITAGRAEALEAALAEERARAATLAEERAAALRGERERADAHEAQVAQLKEMEARLDARFGELATRALGEAQANFLKRADDRFRQSEEAAGAGLKALLQPVTERLERYEEGVRKVEAERRDAFGELRGQIEAMRVGQERVSGEAAKLVNALRNAPKARGRWGEQQLRNVLESCGLAEHTDFAMEVSVADGEGGRLRPDAIVRVPGGKSLIIDAKVSLNAYQDAFGAVDEAERKLGLAAHAQSMRNHVTGLGAKSYWTQFADVPEYVVMFVPGEHFLSAALEHDPGLWDYAFDRRVLLATPTNLIAIARTVSAVWRQEKLAAEAAKIAKLGRDMHERLAVAAGHLKSVGGGLSSAVANYNKFVSSFEGRLMVTGREFEKLNVETGGKAIPDLAPIEALPRYAEGEAAAG